MRVVPRCCNSEDVFSVLPWWGISTRQAAGLLGCKCSSARYLLNRHKVRFCRVRMGNGGLSSYWDKKQVNLLVKRRQRSFPVKASPEALISLDDALQKLGISRTTLDRYVKRGLLQRYQLRTDGGSRGRHLGNYYLIAQVEQLAEMRNSGLPLPRRQRR